MKVFVIFENGEDEEFDVLEQSSISRAIEAVKKALVQRKETRNIKRFEAEEDFL